MNKYAEWVVYSLGVVAFAVAQWWAVSSTWNAGHKQGMKDYHGACYHIGGLLLDSEEGTVVQCMPLISVPKEEIPKLKKELDKDTKV